jgi:transcriptional regulator with XRE-family HTH domain
MNAARMGRVLRGIRFHQGLSQRAVAKRAGVSQSVYSRAERGDVEGMTLGSLDRLAEALGASLHLDIRYRGGLGDRLADASHARLVDIVVKFLRAVGWLVELEFGFNVYGERGSVDVLAWHAPTRTLLIIEVKSRFTDLQSMLFSLSRKLRLVPALVRNELHWDAAVVGRVVVAYASHGNRSVVAAHAAMFDAVLPARSMAVRKWLRAPRGPMAGVWLVSPETVRRRNLDSNGER